MDKYVLEAVKKHAEEMPEKTALVSGINEMSYAALWAQICESAETMRAFGVQPGECIVLQAASRPSFVANYLAAQMINAVPVLIEKKGSAQRIREVLEDTGAHVIADAKGNLSAADAEAFSLTDTEMPDFRTIAMILYTSGSTGRAKAVLHTHASIQAIVQNTLRGAGLTGEDRLLLPLPLQHSFAMRELQSALTIGATIVLQNGTAFSGDLIRNIEKNHCTALAAVPATMAVLKEQLRERFTPVLGTLRLLEIGAGSLTPQQRRELPSLLPQTRIMLCWGSTETGGVLFLDLQKIWKDAGYGSSSHLSGPAARRIDACGIALPGTEVRIIDGRMALKGAFVMQGYLRRAEETAAAFRDGCLLTNDLASIDEDGYIFIHGRADDMINVGGEKVPPKELEDAARRFPGVKDCAAFAIKDPDDILGAVPVLLVSCSDVQNPLDKESLRTFLAGQLEAYKLPQQILLVERIPQTGMGKLNRKHLSQQYTQLMGMSDGHHAAGSGETDGLKDPNQAATVNTADETELALSYALNPELTPALHAILSRRSIRHFTEEPIPEVLLKQVLKAGLQAPSGNNRQSWRFTVLTDAAEIRALKALCVAQAEGRGSEGIGCYGFDNPAALILISNDRRNPDGIQDASCAAENILLAAHALGLGGVWINVLMKICDEAPIRAKLDAYGLPQEHIVWCMAALGYPAEKGRAIPRKDAAVWNPHLAENGRQ